MLSNETVDKVLEFVKNADLTVGSKTAYIRAWRGISMRKHPGRDNKKLADYVKKCTRELDYAPASEKEVSNKISMSLIIGKRENYPDYKISRRQVMNWLASQETHQLYWPTKNTVDIRATVLKEPHSQIGIDLVDMSNKEYKGHKWILTGYDLFSKMGYAVPMKDKTEKTVTTAMKKLLLIIDY